MKFARSALDLVGKTPLLRLERYAPDVQLYAKCEFKNPISVKDRPVIKIIEDAEADGRIKPGMTLVEATSGNTGMAIAWVSAIKGYKCLLVMSEIQSVERRAVMRALGAELIFTPADLGTAGAKARLQELLEEHPEYFYVGQHQNPSNPQCHYEQMGPELWEDTEGKLDFFVGGMGTGGTLCGAGRYLKRLNPAVKIVGLEPEEAPFISKGEFQPHRLMGTSPGFKPAVLDEDQIDEIVLVSEADAFEACRQIAQTEGLLVGVSSGASALAAARIARRPENEGKILVCMFADQGHLYLSIEDLFPR
jgi:cysteine synthase A